MPETPTFGRYAEIPYEQMTPEQQDAYRSLIGQPSQMRAGALRIDPGHPATSFVVDKLTHNLKRGQYKQSFSLSREGTGALLPVVVP